MTYRDCSWKDLYNRQFWISQIKFTFWSFLLSWYKSRLLFALHNWWT